MANALEVGVGRLGWLVDGNSETPQVATLLEDDGQSITLTVPWPDDKGSPYEAWFTGREMVAPGVTSFPVSPGTEMPTQLWFYDVDGWLALVGCRRKGMRRHMFNHGQGRVDVRFAVLGGRGDYQRLTGLRSEVPGLASWVGIRGIEQSTTTDDQGLVQAVAMTVESQPKIELGGPLELRIRPAFATTLGSDGTATIQESMQLQTKSTEPTAWEDHLSEHRSLRDLVSVASWRPVGVRNLWAHRAEHPLPSTSRDLTAPRWDEVRTYEVSSAPNPVALRGQDYLFSFEDIGPDGYTEWAKLQREFARGMAPLVSLVDPGMFLQTRVVQSGIGFEAIGFQLAIESGLNPSKADKETHEARLDRIVAALPGDLLVGLGTWAHRSKEVYTSIKHAARELPSHLDQLNTERENELVFRTWVAIRLGVDPQVLRWRLQSDPMTEPYVLA